MIDVASPRKVVVTLPVRKAAATSRSSPSAWRPLSASSAGRLRAERNTYRTPPVTISATPITAAARAHATCAEGRAGSLMLRSA